MTKKATYVYLLLNKICYNVRMATGSTQWWPSVGATNKCGKAATRKHGAIQHITSQHSLSIDNCRCCCCANRATKQMWFFLANSSKRHIFITIHLIAKFKAHSRQITIHHFIKRVSVFFCYLCYVCLNNANVDNLISTLFNFGQWKGEKRMLHENGLYGRKKRTIETISIYIYESSMWPDDIKFYVMALACLPNISTS